MSGSPRVVVLLTATIDPGDTEKVSRRDPRNRFADYRNALRDCWIDVSANGQVIFCENSGWDLSELEQLCTADSARQLHIEFLSLRGNKHLGRIGKGAGELEIIAYALEHSKFISDDNPFVLKVTGRLAVQNAHQMIELARAGGDFDIASDFRKNLRWIDSRVFIARANLLRDYLLPLRSLANDSVGLTFEVLLARAVHRALGDGHRWTPMPCTPDIRGIAATTGTTYPHSKLRWLRRDLFRRAKGWLVSR